MAAPLHPADQKPASRETLYAIIGSAVVATILACVLAGNPFRALRLAYLDVSHTPAGGAASAGTVNPTQTAPVPPK